MTKLPIINQKISASLIILVIGLWLCLTFNPTGWRSQLLTIPLDSQRQTVAQLYLPEPIPDRPPLVILCHGINSSKEFMTFLAVELARQQVAALTFDFSGFGESVSNLDQKPVIANIDEFHLADTRTVLAFVRQTNRFDNHRLGIGGHSMGGTAALSLAKEDSQLRATIVLGIGGLALPNSPQNLLFGVGTYDELNPVWELRDDIIAAAGKNVAVGKISGDFTAGTARMLVVSPTADHFTAPYDPYLLAEAVNWTIKALDVKSVRPVSLVMPWYTLGWMAIFSSGLGTVANLIWQMARQRSRWWHYGLSLSMVAIDLLIWIASGKLISPAWASNILLFNLALQLLVNYALRCQINLLARCRLTALYTILLLCAFALPGLINGSNQLIVSPSYILQVPQFLLQWSVFLIYNTFLGTKTNFFVAYSFQVVPSYLFLGLVGLEVIFPGIVLFAGEKATKFTIKWCRQPWQIRGVGNLSGRSLAILGVLVLVLLAILYQRVQSGLLVEVVNRGWQAIQLFLQLVLVPALLMIFAVRSPVFQNIEKRLK